MKFRTAGERCPLIIRTKTAVTVLWTQIQQSRQSSGDINSKVLAARRNWRNSTRDPETQPRHRATLAVGSVDLDRPRPWHLSSVLTSYNLPQHPFQQETELGVISGFGWQSEKAALDWVVAWINFIPLFGFQS